MRFNFFQKPIQSHVSSTPNQQSQHSYHQPPRPSQEPPAQSGHQNSSQANQQPGQQPVEFNHAINYVNKIKVGTNTKRWSFVGSEHSKVEFI